MSFGLKYVGAKCQRMIIKPNWDDIIIKTTSARDQVKDLNVLARQGTEASRNRCRIVLIMKSPNNLKKPKNHGHCTGSSKRGNSSHGWMTAKKL
ncbi:hypothetical protein Lal_00042282 [Lupinus albus]|nr:hypothetical protein Lal_00042282 [Lupinus albus]